MTNTKKLLTNDLYDIKDYFKLFINEVNKKINLEINDGNIAADFVEKLFYIKSCSATIYRLVKISINNINKTQNNCEEFFSDLLLISNLIGSELLPAFIECCNDEKHIRALKFAENETAILYVIYQAAINVWHKEEKNDA